MSYFCFFWLAASCVLSDASFITTTGPTPTLAARAELAITPTSPGQVGINPVESDLGDATTYVGEIYGTDTQYIIVQTSTTQWVGTNTDFLTVETINPTSTSTIHIIVATATAAANGQSIGDISVILPEGLAKGLQDSVTPGVSACNAVPAKQRRRINSISRDAADAVLTCLLGYAAKDVNDGALFDKFVNVEAWNDVAVNLAAEATAALQAGFAGLSASQRVKTIMWLAVAANIIDVLAEAKRLGQTPQLGPIGKINIPAGGFASVSKTGCPSGAKKNIDSPLCQDYDCQGVNDLCVVDPNKNCPCLQIVPDPTAPYQLAQTYLELQQSVLAAAISLADSATTTWDCSIVATVFPKSLQSVGGSGTVRYCTCGSIIAGIGVAVSATSTTSYCETGAPPPGWTAIPGDVNGYPLSTPVPTATQTVGPCDPSCRNPNICLLCP